jgi:hypothetical protein
MKKDLSSIFKGANVQLEKTAVDKFGAVIEGGVRGALLGKPTPPPTQSTRTPRPPSTWIATSYAAALAGSDYRPKLKFLFKVQFVFKPEIVALYPQLGGASGNDFTFMIKTVDRPKVDFEYEDDVNVYNFRTKALKKIRHRELTVTFMDDVGNRVFEFFRTMMEIHSPITRGGRLRDQTTEPPLTNSAGIGGMAFDTGVLGNAVGSHRDVINTNFGGAIDSIRVKQMFLDQTQANLEQSPRQVMYDFVNPRIISFDLDDLSHDASDASLLTMQFDFDWMEMVKMDSMAGPDAPIYIAAGKNITGAPSDQLPGGSGVNVSLGSASPIPKAGGGNPFLKILDGAGTRATQKISSDIIGRGVRAVAGNGRLATQLSGSVSSGLNGLVAGATRGRVSGGLANLGTGISNSSFVTNLSSAFNTRTGNTAVASDSTTTAGTVGVNSLVRSTDPGGF